MANIRNSISMTDRMTPTLRSILKSMDSMLRVMRDLDRASNNGAQSKAYRRAEKDLKRANNQLIKMGNYNRMVARSAGEGERAYRRMGSAVSGAANNMRSLAFTSSMFLQSLASGVYLARELANAVKGVMDTADTARSQVARLGLYNTSQYSTEALYGHVFRTAMNTRSGLTETADLANKILISGVYTGESSVQAAIGTAGIINKALVAGGGTSEENQRAIRQLTQGLASGVLQGDELRSIREQAPYFAQVLAEGLSKVDEEFEGIGIGDLKRLGSEGELTADRVVKAMWAMQDEINKDFEAMPKTFGQALTSLSNIWQYFLWMLSDAEGPLGRLNDKLWQFVEYLQSPQGLELLNSVAKGIDIISWALTSAMDAVGRFVVFLQENSAIAQAAFIALGVAAVVSGAMAAASWIAATWPMLLLIAVVGLVAWAFIDAGYTAQEVVGAIVGGVLWAIAVIWDAVLFVVVAIMYAVGIIVSVVTVVVTTVIVAIQAIVQIILWVVNAILTAFDVIFTVFGTIGLALWGGVQWLASKIVDRIYNTVTTVLSLLAPIAAAIDAIFGSDLSGKITTFSTKVDETYATVQGALDYKGTFSNIGEMWEQFGDRTSDRWSVESDWNITDNMANVLNGAENVIEGTWDLVGQGEDFLGGYLVDPTAAYNAGSEWGIGVVDSIGDFGLGLPDNSVFDMFNADGVTVDGGYLDGIKSDVNISDEDVQLLRDMAARDFLLQLQAITPVANVTFGDVRETADVNKIVEVIEQMVDEQMATALVS